MRRSGCGARPGQVETQGAGEPGGGGAGRASAERARGRRRLSDLAERRALRPRASPGRRVGRRGDRPPGNTQVPPREARAAGAPGAAAARRRGTRAGKFQAAEARPRARRLLPRLPSSTPSAPAGRNRSLRRYRRSSAPTCALKSPPEASSSPQSRIASGTSHPAGRGNHWTTAVRSRTRRGADGSELRTTVPPPESAAGLGCRFVRPLRRSFPFDSVCLHLCKPTSCSVES